MNIPTIFKQVGHIVMKESPTIFAGLAVTGLATTVVFTITGTIKAIKLLETEGETRLRNWVETTGEDESSYPGEVISKKEVILLTWKCYIPTFVAGISTASCIIFSNSINMRRNAALASLYSLSETAMREYQAKVVEQLGEKKEEKIRDAVAEDNAKKHPIDAQVIVAGNGKVLFFDSLTGRYFYNDLENVRRIQNNFNESLISEMRRSLNELYDELGLEHVKLGDDLGWDIGTGKLEMHFTSKINEAGIPYIIMQYQVAPRYI